MMNFDLSSWCEQGRKEVRQARLLGDWQGDIAASIAGGDLDRVTSAILGLSDQLTSVVESKNSILNGYLFAKNSYDDATRLFGPAVIPMPVVGLAPNPKIYPFLQALVAAQMGVKLLARKAHMLTKLNLVFGQIAASLQRAGLTTDSNSITGVSMQIGRFVADIGNAFSGVPLYMNTIVKLNDAADAEWRLWGVDAGNQNDPRWFQAYIAAANKVVPLPEGTPLMSGLSGLGELGNPLAQILIILIWVIAIVAAAVVAIKTASMAIDALNPQAATAKALILQRDREREVLKLKIISEGKAQGKPDVQIQAEVDTSLKTFDRETNDAVRNIPKSGLLSSIAWPVGIAAAALVGLKVAGVI